MNNIALEIGILVLFCLIAISIVKVTRNVIKEKWRILTKKDRAKRYKTSCLEAVFDSYKPNTMHIDDFQMYASYVGSQEENELQNSYFQTDIVNMKKLNIPPS